MQARVVNLKLASYDVYIGRGSIWGNPYTHITDGKTRAKYIVSNREEAIEKYREYLENSPQLIRRLWELKGKTLGCYCKPLSCHGDVLIELIDKYCV